MQKLLSDAHFRVSSQVPPPLRAIPLLDFPLRVVPVLAIEAAGIVVLVVAVIAGVIVVVALIAGVVVVVSFGSSKTFSAQQGVSLYSNQSNSFS